MQKSENRRLIDEVKAIAAILLVSLALKAYISRVFFGQSSDEFANVFLVREVYTSGMRDYPELFMWFYYFFSALFLPFINDAYIVTTIVSIVFGTASVLLIYLIAKKIFNQETAFLASLLLLFNPEYNLISSVPLKEPVYTFFILASLLLLIYRRVIAGAFMIGMAFLTRAEGLLVGMPLYLANTFNFFSGKKLLRVILAVLAIFIIFITFMNIWVPYPFVYLTQVYDFHLQEQCPQGPIGVAAIGSFLQRAILALSKLSRYLFNLLGPNCVFIIPGLVVFFRSPKERQGKRSTLVYFAFLSSFWLAYIYIFGGLIYNFHRYLFSLIPLSVFLIAAGFLKIWEIKRIRAVSAAVFILNFICGYFFYYQNVGKAYFETSVANKGLISAGDWIEKNIRLDSRHKLLTDGIPGFNLYRKRYVYSVARWDEFGEEIRKNDKEALLGFLDENNIRYVSWSDDNSSAVKIAPYLGRQEEISSSRGKLVPVKSWRRGSFRCNFYEFYPLP